jgi:hypothetical protein
MGGNNMNELRKVFLAITMLLGIIAMVSTATAADDYFVYGVKNTGYYTNAIDGYVINDESGLLYVADRSGYCYIYKVSIPAGSDPDKHPDNPLNTGTMAPRTFEQIGEKYYFRGDCGWDGDHHAEFYISDNYIYYGVYSVGIEKWDKNADGTFGAYLGKVTDKNGDAIPGNGDETFGYDADNNIWYTGDRDRNIYSFDADVDTAWQYEFQYPSYAGSHHDGLEFVNGYLWVSDMTSDYIGQWEYTGTGWNEVDRFSYTNYRYVEGMGFGPLGHFWVSSYSYRAIYEIGGGKLGVALTDIPDQTIPDGGSFVNFDLDDYAGGATGLVWTSSGASVLTVSIDPTTHVCTVTYPSSWTGSETITFTATCPVGNVNSDDATFTVTPTAGVTVESADSSGVKKDTFQIGDPVYAIGSGYTANTIYDLYILNDQTWIGGESLAGAVVTTSVTTDASGNIFPAGTLIWALAVAGNYDIVVDVDGNVQYDASTDALDDMDVNDAGFEAIPEFPTVALPVAAILGLMFLFQRRKD